MEWQDISTAPKDGTSVLIYAYWEGEISPTDTERQVWRACFSFDKWNIEGGDYYSVNALKPTHWMPLPLPPNVSRETQEWD